MKDLTFNVSRVLGILESKNITKKEFFDRIVEKHHVNESSVRKWISGLRNPNAKSILQMADVLGVTPYDIATCDEATDDSDVYHSVVKLPILSNTDMINLSNIDDITNIHLLNSACSSYYPMVVSAYNLKLFALHIKNDAYSLHIPKGSMVIWTYETQQSSESSMVVVYHDSGRIYLRRQKIDGDIIQLFDIVDVVYKKGRAIQQTECVIGTVLQVIVDFKNNQ